MQIEVDVFVSGLNERWKKATFHTFQVSICYVAHIFIESFPGFMEPKYDLRFGGD